MAASFIPIQIDVIRNAVTRNRNSSSFLLHGTPAIMHLSPRTTSSPSPATTLTTPSAKFDLFEIAGGRGLCNGEIGLEKELQRVVVGEPETPSPTPPTAADSPSPPPFLDASGEEAFEKELMGLTGGFPGGEIGLQRFIEKNPPPNQLKPGVSELPLLLPGMSVIVKNPVNPLYLWKGIVQSVTDGKAGIIFEGRNWNKLLTFEAHELEEIEKGRPMEDSISAIHETGVDSKPE